MGTLQLNDKQQRRAGILSCVIGGSISRADGASLLKLSDRQMRRLVSRYERDGLRSVIHGNTDRSPANKLNVDVVDTILELSMEGGKYHGFNVCHAHDLLAESECLSVGRSTVYTLLRKAGVVKPRRQSKQIRRKRRERCSAEGMMVQIDGRLHGSWSTDVADWRGG
jgi:transposase